MSRLYTSQLLTVGKERLTLREWSRITGIKTTTMYWRLKQGFKPEDVIAKPYKHARASFRQQAASLLTVGKETHTLREWSSITGVKTTTMYWRLARDYKPEDVVASPKEHVSLRHRHQCSRGHVMTPENKKQRPDGAVSCRQCSRDQFRAAKTNAPITFARIRARAPQFWKLVKRASGTKCWPWLGKRNTDGYGTFNVGYHVIRAHRMTLTLKLGRMVNGMACHKCGNPWCCRKAHIYEGTGKTNAADTVRHGRTTRGERNSHAKLTDAAVVQIRTLYQQGGTTHRALASRFSVSVSAIALIINKVTWRHV